MAWYLRKSVSVGPIRFNLSKSGIGASVGVTGFRIGMRPDGSSYVHAGRYGLYVRQELGGRKPVNQVLHTHQAQISPTEVYKAVSTQELSSPARKELIDRLNKSQKEFRLDFLVMFISALAFSFAWLNNSQNGMGISILVGVVLSLATSWYEAQRRTIKIAYDFEDNNTSSFVELVKAMNSLAECKSLWAYVDSRYITSLHESKINAGASNLINRESAAAGAGTPPWVETNVTIPSIKARGITLYFMPDCILIYGKDGVGCIEHTSLKYSVSAERFIEDGIIPADSKIVDRTWKYTNKSGGPDRRFKNNKEIPICLYGKLDLSTSAGLLCHLQTSKESAPRDFSRLYSGYLSSIRAKGC